MYGLAGARYTAGMPYLDSMDAEARARERDFKATKPHSKTHVRTKAQRRSAGTDKKGEPIHDYADANQRHKIQLHMQADRKQNGA